MTSRISFFPAGSNTVSITGGSRIANYSMPAVDGSNVDTAVANNTNDTIWCSFAAGAPAGPNVVGALQIAPGQTVLLTANAAVLAAANNALVIGVAQPPVAAASTTVSISANQNGAVTITRGTASAVIAF